MAGTTHHKVLIVGGEDNNGWLPNAEIYDPATGIWTQTGDMMEGRTAATANLLPDGRVFVAGGLNVSLIGLTSIEEYDPLQGAWHVSHLKLHDGRFSHTTTTLLDGSLIVAGGSHRGFNLAREAELFVMPR